jgi:HK97 gp10 family phage protein
MSIDVRLVVDGDADLAKKLRFKQAQVAQLLKEAVEDIAAHAESEAKKRAPRQTGNLFKNIKATRASKGASGGFEATMGVRRTAPYGVFVEHGTGIYAQGASAFGRGVIKPKTGNVLAFKVKGKTVFAQYVKGQKAQHYFRDAIAATNSAYVPGRLAELSRRVGNLSD